MAEPVKYIKVVGDMLSIYQKELLRLYKKCNDTLTQILMNSS